MRSTPSCAKSLAYRLPDTIDDEHAAPLLCTGIIEFGDPASIYVSNGARGFEFINLRLSAPSGESGPQALEIYVLVMSRGGVHRDLARELAPIGSATHSIADRSTRRFFLHRPATFPAAMQTLDRRRSLAIAGVLRIRRSITAVCSNVRSAALPQTPAPTATSSYVSLGKFPIRTCTVGMTLHDANRALQMLKHDELRGAAVLHMP